MKVRAVLAGVLTALALVAISPTALQRAPSPAAQGDEAASEGALRGLEKALTRHCSYASNGFLRRFDAKDFRGCRVTYELTPQVPPGHSGYVPAAERTTVELSSLDAALIEVRPGRRGADDRQLERDGDGLLSLALECVAPREDVRGRFLGGVGAFDEEEELFDDAAVGAPCLLGERLLAEGGGQPRV